MSEENKEICRRLYGELISEGRYETLDELVDEDVIEHEEIPGQAPGREGVRQTFEMMRSAFPDLRAEISQMVAEGDRVAIHGIFSGTQEGEFMDIPASGKRMEIEVIDILRFADGKVVEHWGLMNELKMMQQLGVIEE